MLIGLVGHIAAGKSTIAKWLRNEYEIDHHGEMYSFMRYAFGDHLKFLLRISKIPQTRKNMQEFGDAMRSWRPNIWVDYVKYCMDEDNWPFQVIDDVRFVNEAQFVLDRGGFLIGLVCNDDNTIFERVLKRYDKQGQYMDWLIFQKQLQHKSETDVEKCLSMCHMRIPNDYDLEGTKSAIKGFIENERRKQRDHGEEAKPTNEETTEPTWREGCY